MTLVTRIDGPPLDFLRPIVAFAAIQLPSETDPRMSHASVGVVGPTTEEASRALHRIAGVARHLDMTLSRTTRESAVLERTLEDGRLLRVWLHAWNAQEAGRQALGASEHRLNQVGMLVFESDRLGYTLTWVERWAAQTAGRWLEPVWGSRVLEPVGSL